MRNCKTLLAALLLLASAAFGQTDANTAQNHVIVKFSPLTMFDGDNTVQFGVEVPLGKSDITIQQDLGYGTSDFSIWYAHENDRPNKGTFKSRTHLRYYYYEKTRFRAYLAGEFMYKRVVYNEREWVGRDCANFQCGFYQEMPVKIVRRALAFHPRLGWQFYFPRRLTLDVFFGVGLRNVRVKNPGITQGGFFFSGIDDIWATSPTNDVIPSIALGFHLGVALGKFSQK